MKSLIKTERLLLRPMTLDDAADLTSAANDIEVAKWLSALPHPYVMADAEAFILATEGQALVKGIEYDGRLIGAIRIKDTGFGYWMARRHWGQGIMSEASTAYLDAYFATSRASLFAYHLIGNTASARVLANLGFLNNDQRMVDTLLHGKIEAQYMTLTYQRWLEVCTPLQGGAQSSNAA